MPSSVIREMRFDPMQRVLEIAFRGVRGVYRYFDVPAEEWRRFQSAPSKGAYLNGFFKSKGFRFTKADAPLISVKDYRGYPYEHDDRQHDTELLRWSEA
jgi:hypothetical protein